MGQKVNLQKRHFQYGRTDLNLPKVMSEVHELRKQVCLAEAAARAKQIVARPTRSVNIRSKSSEQGLPLDDLGRFVRRQLAGALPDRPGPILGKTTLDGETGPKPQSRRD
ncbi:MULTISPECIES: hypothetical protein [Bradyrhizobium]|uniref:hypothetical protein n=1 Tax=Bradyrhizobium TaxID=374 RepID=UPI00115F941C|nr:MULTISPECIES: hypothetical protein [Bradyrhizobium]